MTTRITNSTLQVQRHSEQFINGTSARYRLFSADEQTIIQPQGKSYMRHL